MQKIGGYFLSLFLFRCLFVVGPLLQSRPARKLPTMLFARLAHETYSYCCSFLLHTFSYTRIPGLLELGAVSATVRLSYCRPDISTLVVGDE